MTISIGLVLFVIFLSLSGLHFYWGVGGKWGMEASLPTQENHEKVMNPGLVACFVVAFGLLGFGIFALIKSQLISFALPSWLLNYGFMLIPILFVGRAVGEFHYVGFFKKIKNTKFAQMDTKYYSPLCLFIGILGIILAIIS